MHDEVSILDESSFLKSLKLIINHIVILSLHKVAWEHINNLGYMDRFVIA